MWHFKVVFMLPHVWVTSGVIPSIRLCPSKWRFKFQPSIQVQHLASKDWSYRWYLSTLCIKLDFKWSTLIFTSQISCGTNPFMVIDDKGGEIWVKICLFGQRLDKYIREMRVQIWTWIKREQHWRIEGDQILGQEKHTSRGSKLMNLIDCIWCVHIHMLACICINFKFNMQCLCAMYASHRAWMMIW